MVMFKVFKGLSPILFNEMFFVNIANPVQFEERVIFRYTSSLNEDYGFEVFPTLV